MTVTMEIASNRHLNTLHEIEKTCFKEEAFTKQQISILLADYNSICLIAKEDDQAVGFIIGAIGFERHSLTGHILTIDVPPAHQRKNIGTRLLREIESLFKQKNVTACRLEVREDNIAAITLYEKLGYKKIGKLENYYGSKHGFYFRKTLA